MSTHAESVRAGIPPLGGNNFNEENSTTGQSTRPRSYAGRAASVGAMASNGQLAHALGWFSVILGTTQLVAPRQLARAIGVPDSPLLMRSCGVRELASGLAILLSPEWTSTALKARVAGDALDLGALGVAMARGTHEDRTRASVAALAVAGVTALDVLAARQYEEAPADSEVIIALRKSIAINMASDVLYQAWNDFESLPNIMRHLESVTALDGGRSHWVARAPAGMRVEWDAEVIANEPNQLIAWRSLPGSQIENMGSVRFEPLPGRRGTLLSVELEYHPPAGHVGRAIAKLFGEEPQVQLHEDLRRFKQMMETGEIATTRSQPAGRRSLKYRLLSKKEPANAR
jgi:uncharacterized membrane protein